MVVEKATCFWRKREAVPFERVPNDSDVVAVVYLDKGRTREVAVVIRSKFTRF
jgi:hypothetical protein